MGEKTKQEEISKKKDVDEDAAAQGELAEVIEKKKSYYYDDAHGYEIYSSEMNDEENDED